jgi:two-component system nitrogen regulation response regulator NtrX
VSQEQILIVDDEPGVRSALEAILGDEGFGVAAVATGEEGLETLDREPFDAVLLDVWLPGIDGLETLKQLRERRIDTEVVMISGHGTIDTAVRATKLGAFDFVEKPLSLEKTLVVIRNALRQRRLEKTNVQLLEQLSRDTEIVGPSAAAEKLRREVEVAAESTAHVLISGENGVGRETVARRIHSAAGAPDAPFVEVPGGALDAAAAEAALFGEGLRPGRIDLAVGGTLFVEDADRLPDEIQGRLAAAAVATSRETQGLRVMASVPPGDVGLTAELRQLLEVIRIDVPSLRERREDVPLLVERFMRELSREYGRQSKRLAPECLAALRAHSWPGNVRELRNLIERLLLFVEGEVVGVEDLPQDLGGSRTRSEDLYREFSSLQEGVRAFERYYISRVVTEQGGDTAAAAKRLGIPGAEIKRRLKDL